MRVHGYVSGVCRGHDIVCWISGGETGILRDCLRRKSQSSGSWISGPGERSHPRDPSPWTPSSASAKWKTKRSTLARILKDLLPPDGWDYWAVGSRGASSGLKPETAQRPLTSMPSWLELVPAEQQSIPLASVAGVREQQVSLDPIPPSFSSPRKAQQGLGAQRR